MSNSENIEQYGHLMNEELQKEIEKEVTWYLRENFSFSVIEVENKEERKALKFKLVATISNCGACSLSTNWLGLNSPKNKVRENGLWQEQGISGDGLTSEDLERIKSLCRK